MITQENDQTSEPNNDASVNTTTEEATPSPQPKTAPVFNWDSTDKGDVYSEEERMRMAQQYDQTLNLVAEHEIVEGTVVSITSKDVLVNIGYKSDGLVPLAEFRHVPDLKIGDKVEVYIETQEDSSGQLILSHKKARALKSWDRVNEALAKEEVIQGFVKCRTKGGLIVDVFGIEAFLPGSQIDVKPIRDYDQFVNKNMEFKVVKINNEFKNVVVSHKILIEEELEQQKAEIMKRLEKGQVLEGTVKNITSYGVFMDLGGVDGLLHITDLSWGRVNHPEEIVKLDQKLQVVILDFDDEKKRIALGLKQLTPHPWTQLEEALKVGDKVKGKVILIADYGAFVEIVAGVEGLMHVSEMSWSQHLRSPHDFMKVGDEIEAVILTLDREERKMSLGLKQLKPDPWTNVAEKYPVGSKHTTTVKNFQPFGVFVELEEGVDGLVHISDLSWTKKLKHPNEFCKVGDKLDVVVLEVDAENRRLSLGHKQLEENPWDVFESLFSIGSVHEGTVLKNADKGAVVALPYGIEGFVPGKHMVKEDGKTTLKVDEKALFKIIEFNKDQKRIVISHSRLHEDKAYEAKSVENKGKEREKEDTTRTVKRMKESTERTTLGDISALSDLKDQMEASEKKKVKKKKDSEVTASSSDEATIASTDEAKTVTTTDEASSNSVSSELPPSEVQSDEEQVTVNKDDSKE